MEQNQAEKYRKIGLICGVVMMVAGIVITVVSVADVELDPSWRLFSGIIFIAVGFLYIVINSAARKK